MASAPKKPALAPAPAAVKPAEAPLAPAKAAVPLAPAPEAVETMAETLQAAMLEPAKVVEAIAEPMREIQGQMRDAAEKGLDETRVAFDRLRVVAEETTTAFEASLKNAADGVQTFNLQLVEAMRVNAEANFDFLKALVGVKSVSEAIALNTEHVRKSFDALSAQSKEPARRRRRSPPTRSRRCARRWRRPSPRPPDSRRRFDPTPPVGPEGAKRGVAPARKAGPRGRLSFAASRRPPRAARRGPDAIETAKFRLAKRRGAH
ncbi:MAG: phasin family protein [Rhodoblastus sp.]|nr:MAG: phasin family protein [Rhodoblastus sp.]